MSTEKTRETMLRYLESDHRDVSMMDEQVVFTIMATGAEHRGRESVMEMLNYFYHVAFDASATTRLTLFGETSAMVESDFIGKHIGEFAGIPATGKSVSVPICVVYELADNKIKCGRVYFEMSVLFKQIGAS